jgi:hypothetical protein
MRKAEKMDCREICFEMMDGVKLAKGHFHDKF